ncbi:MAG: hypothetical protein DRJ41_02430, partial [Thermoprotei archaeon]
PEYFDPGPLTLSMRQGGLLYVEEFNRVPEETANVLITAAEERELHIPRYGTVKADPLFRIVCAMNPYDDVGTRHVSRALLDRFVKIRMDYQSKEEEIEIVKRKTAFEDPRFVELAVEIARRTRSHPAVRMGSSVRGAIDMILMLKEMKRMKNAFSLEDLEMIALMAFTSKIWLSDLSISPEQVVKEILRSVLSEKSPFWRRNKENLVIDDHSSLEQVTNDYSSSTSDAFNRLIRRSRIAPRRAALEIEKNSLMLDGLSRMGLRGLECIARVMDYLNPTLKELAQKYARELIIRYALRNNRSPSEVATSSDVWNYIDLNLDKTLENIIESGFKSLDKLAVYKRLFGRDKYAIILDKSSSMAGVKIVIGALVVSIIAFANRNIKDYMVIAFDDEVTLLKELGVYVDVEELIDKILSLKPSGYTDISLALSVAYNEMISKNSVPKAILVTDGEWTKGENPLKVSRLFHTLHVICVPSKWVGFAKMLADTGNGNFIFVDSISDIGRHLSDLWS